MTFSHIIDDKIPALALLGSEHQVISGFTTQGDQAIPLHAGSCIQVQLPAPSEPISGLRLRFATYCRRNHCHITLICQADQSCSVRFNAQYLADNTFIDIALPLAQSCQHTPQVTLSIYCDDADADNVVALWCRRRPPVFMQQLNSVPLALTKPKRPTKVSIVIPVFNKALYTYNCLLALQACDQDINQEIIIVDNASTDETPALLAPLTEQIKVIQNEENTGFVTACCQGAQQAEGELIVFLNNDTQVMPDWLTSMVDVMATQPQVGITGSKLIYPDGRLQEAGGIIFNDGSGYNYGRFQDPSDSEFNQPRWVDYCSGASLMIRKSLWQQLGGFDSRFAPAYYEDTDLCFAARHAGYQVCYCPQSEVIHHEGITAGTDITAGYKAFQAVNRDKFIAKWQQVLQKQHYPSNTLPEQAIARLSE
ncbi:MAG: glycosyltransferase family 2 protein [Pseudomonadota bacterium]|nr:glycosyltransferase family 2 protein [Pseudomonadota bacterium]